ncbi:hypothetical protein [Burkholderia ubonensis]|uniref:hypothetical protein n=1 Tax=Burkholderia ubonensis TaxID=101571 RepID=UPI001160A404|nr:hypothetical protein [Burkholderia ubonensis]
MSLFLAENMNWKISAMILANLLREKCVKFVNICAKARRELDDRRDPYRRLTGDARQETESNQNE